MSTIRDIAEHAGVSVSTASLALNDDPRVRSATRQRVLASARALDYHPTRAARSLSVGRTYALHLLDPLVGTALSGSFFARFARGVHDEAEPRSYSVALSLLGDEREASEVLERLIRERWSDGVIVMNPSDDGTLFATLDRHSFPHVLLGRAAGAGPSSVDSDNEAVGYDAAHHLLGDGRRPLALINGPERHTFTRDRARGFRRACREAGIDDRDATVVFTDGSLAAGRDAAHALLRRPAPPRGIAAVSDLLAVGALGAADDLGLGVPDEVALLGMNDDTLCQVVRPQLSSIDLDAYGLGRAACGLLLERIAEPAAPPVRRLVPHRLVPRSSSR